MGLGEHSFCIVRLPFLLFWEIGSYDYAKLENTLYIGICPLVNKLQGVRHSKIVYKISKSTNNLRVTLEFLAN